MMAQSKHLFKLVLRVAMKLHLNTNPHATVMSDLKQERDYTTEVDELIPVALDLAKAGSTSSLFVTLAEVIRCRQAKYKTLWTNCFLWRN